MSVYGIALSHAPPAWKSHGSENRLHAVRLCNFQAGGAWNWAIPCWGKVAVARGKRGLGKVAKVDWHEISACAIKNSTFQLGSQISKIATCPLLYHLPTRSNTPPAAAGGDRRGGHTPAPLVRRRAREVGRQRCRRPRVVPIHCTVERAPLGHGRRAPPMVTALAGAVFDRVGRWQFSRFVIQVESLRI